ncbi:MAG: 23S rRNA (adenine(2503)-C(2))-methyltransferase RlmN [Crenarchaeota archaeon]|nr:MAG: 23S rRNA (adenine(2503)-C(2))-methyltransferase RlmN [Thermoproteota archaeon]RDJ34185.1 MAG: 23S rRNA (adenine(2503)-C(2))-methyltransferase RlmN [Thermoproteota archaeon]RDJ36700.1 MAG: 23S rRNA (adenine(2503)-C(2))-methyltransferase RlmN [Thermoproteota archaeon]RDJ37767.1 MAG: 23S rRNA (adenine(2503)-C(2))-methyltransferase RlmN [Thermoproteota archaeon]
MTDLYRLYPEEMEEMVKKLGYERFRADQILHYIYKEFPVDINDMLQLPAAMREKLISEGYSIGSAKQTHMIQSDNEDTVKLLLELDDKKSVETVLMRYRPLKLNTKTRHTVCVSTQVGCAMGCTFCATGQMGFERNMKAEEIVTQVIHFANLLKERGEHVTNLVFMGMGEPLANYDEMIRAIRLLTNPRAFGLGQRHITVSTIGLVSGISRLAGEDLQIGLAVSLHAPNDTLRRKLVPTASPNSVSEIIESGREYFKRTGRRVTFEYALIEGVNDTPEIANELAELLDGNGSHINLIPLNPTAGNFSRPAKKRILEFERVLYRHNINCTVRVEKGVEIAAACGQLRTDVLNEKAAKLP